MSRQGGPPEDDMSDFPGTHASNAETSISAKLTLTTPNLPNACNLFQKFFKDFVKRDYQNGAQRFV